jgi:hypothetical protein
VAQTFASGVLNEARNFYYSDQWQVLEERAGRSAPDRQFVWGLRYVDDLVFRDRDTAGNGTLDERLYALQDPNWNVTAFFAASAGSAAERYQYSAYGEPTFLTGVFTRSASSLYEADTLYCGYRWDAIAQSYLVRNRALWAHLGRWDRRDPIENIPTLGYFGIWWFDRYEDYAYAGGRALSATDPSGMTPLANPLPIWGSPPVYQPERWNTNPKLLKSNNCMSYAFNRPMGSNGHYRSNGLPQPDGTKHFDMSKQTCDTINGYAKSKWGAKDLDEKGCCSKGYHKVALVLSPNVDYHWYRQDTDPATGQPSGWSCKLGGGIVTNQAGGNPITDPATANPAYPVDCGQLCAPD